ncbi:MAG: hypothetical protein ABJL99_12325 [Aliishimia sp.]
MAMQDQDIAELEKLVKKARQKPLPFGLCLGKKPEDNVMFLDLKKSPEVMMRKAKAEGETSKVTFGHCDVQGKIMTLSLDGKLLPGMAKNMKKFLSGIKLKMKVVIADPDGNVLEDDGEPEEEGLENENDDNNEDDAIDDNTVADSENIEAEDNTSDTVEEQVAETENDTQDVDPAAEQWGKISGALTPLVQRFAAGQDPRAAAIAKAWDGAEAAAGNGDFKSAMAVAGKLRPILTAPAAAAEPANTSENTDADTATQDTKDPNAAKWQQIEAAITALYTKAMGNNPPNRSKLEAAWGMAVECAEMGDFTKALTIATRLKPQLDTAAAATTSGQDGEIPKDVVPFQKSRILWQSSRKKMFEEVGKLEKAIVDACAGDEELASVAQAASSLTDRLSGFDEKLEDILEQITVTPEGAERSKLKQDAVGAIETYQAALQDPFFQDVDKKNGFVEVKVAATATASLSSIAKVLAA